MGKLMELQNFIGYLFKRYILNTVNHFEIIAKRIMSLYFSHCLQIPEIIDIINQYNIMWSIMLEVYKYIMVTGVLLQFGMLYTIKTLTKNLEYWTRIKEKGNNLVHDIKM